jgi:hypothetical protein
LRLASSSLLELNRCTLRGCRRPKRDAFDSALPASLTW